MKHYGQDVGILLVRAFLFLNQLDSKYEVLFRSIASTTRRSCTLIWYLRYRVNKPTCRAPIKQCERSFWKPWKNKHSPSCKDRQKAWYPRTNDVPFKNKQKWEGSSVFQSLTPGSVSSACTGCSANSAGCWDCLFSLREPRWNQHSRNRRYRELVGERAKSGYVNKLIRSVQTAIAHCVTRSL